MPRALHGFVPAAGALENLEATDPLAAHVDHAAH
jgi:hypothetical protein